MIFFTGYVLPKFCDACADHDGEITVHELGRVMRNHGLNPTGSVSIEISLQILCHFRKKMKEMPIRICENKVLGLDLKYRRRNIQIIAKAF